MRSHGLLAGLVILGACGSVLDRPDARVADAEIDAAPSHSVGVTRSGNGTGTITSTPAGIDCGADCSGAFSQGSTVTLRAVPSSDSAFVGWAGGGCSGTADCSLTVTGDVTTGAMFALRNSVVVTLTGNGAGTVTSAPGGIFCPGDCSEAYAPGQTITLTASPGALSIFTGWSGGGCSGTGPCTVMTSMAVGIVANFAIEQHAITVTKAGNGAGTVTSNPAGIDCGSTCSSMFDAATMVTLTAASSIGSTFTGWSGAGCTGTGTCVVTIAAAATVTATFTLERHILTVAKAGAGSGTVTSNPGGIDCGPTCADTFNYGQSVTLTATADAGYTFTGWSGGGCTGTGTCLVPVLAATTVTATFEITRYTLTVTKPGNGAGTVTSNPAGIDCGATCNADFVNGQPVTLTAAAMTGSTFTGWSGGGCSGTSTCVVALTAATTVAASFTLDQHLVTVSKDGTGAGTVISNPMGIACGATCAFSFNYGESVTLMALPSAGATFTGWSGSACTGTGTCVVSVTAAASVNATFTQDQYTITVNKAGTGAGTVTSSPAGISCGATCTAAFNSGEMVTLTPMASMGSTFMGWSGGSCTGTGTCVVSVMAATTVTATFRLDQHDVTVSNVGSGTGTVTSNPAAISCTPTCTATFDFGQMVTLTAVASPFSTFSGWSGGGCSGNGTCVVTVMAATTVTATFALDQYPLNVTRNGTGSGTVTSNPGGINCGADCVEQYFHSTSVVLTASPTGGSVFAGWSGACGGTGTCTVSMISAQAVTATFTSTAPPPCQTGTAGVNSGANWIVCSADATTAWLSANNGGSYNPTLACQSLGYTGVSRWGGTCGNVCGYCEGSTSCSSPGNKFFGGGGGNATSLSFTVHWECTR